MHLSRSPAFWYTGARILPPDPMGLPSCLCSLAGTGWSPKALCLYSFVQPCPRHSGYFLPGSLSASGCWSCLKSRWRYPWPQRLGTWWRQCTWKPPKFAACVPCRVTTKACAGLSSARALSGAAEKPGNGVQGVQLSLWWEMVLGSGSKVLWAPGPLLWNYSSLRSYSLGLWWEGQSGWSLNCLTGHPFIVLEKSSCILLRWLITRLITRSYHLLATLLTFFPEQAFLFFLILIGWESSKSLSCAFPFN